MVINGQGTTKSFFTITAKGTMNFTSIQPVTHPAVTQPSQGAVTQPSQGAVTQVDSYREETEDGPAHAAQDDDNDELTVLDQPPANTSRDKRGKSAASSRTGKDEGVGHKRRQDGRVAEMMERCIELKEKQAKAEEEERARAKAEEEERARIIANNDDFPIATCIAVVDGMDELSDDEKVDAYDVFKDPQNRVIFMTAKDATRIKWLRKKIARI